MLAYGIALEGRIAKSTAEHREDDEDKEMRQILLKAFLLLHSADLF